MSRFLSGTFHQSIYVLRRTAEQSSVLHVKPIPRLSFQPRLPELDAPQTFVEGGSHPSNFLP